MGVDVRPAYISAKRVLLLHNILEFVYFLVKESLQMVVLATGIFDFLVFHQSKVKVLHSVVRLRLHCRSRQDARGVHLHVIVCKTTLQVGTRSCPKTTQGTSSEATGCTGAKPKPTSCGTCSASSSKGKPPTTTTTKPPVCFPWPAFKGLDKFALPNILLVYLCGRKGARKTCKIRVYLSSGNG